MMCGYRVCHDNDGVTRLRFASVHLRPPLPSMLFVLRPPRPRPPLPRPRPPTRCGLRPVTSSASSAASRANTASLSDASVASAFLLAARAARGAGRRRRRRRRTPPPRRRPQHSRHRCFPGPLLLSCAREKASAGLSALHAAHSCVATVLPSSATRSFAVSAASARSASAADAVHFYTYLSARILPRLVRHVLAELHRGEALATACRAVERAVPLCRIAPGSNAQVRHRFPRHARVRAGTPGVSLEFPCV